VRGVNPIEASGAPNPLGLNHQNPASLFMTV
jgi:hypothetical protein